MKNTPAPLLLLTQGHAGDRLGAILASGLLQRFPERELMGVGGDRMVSAGVRLLARTDNLSAMGWTGVIPLLPKLLQAVFRTSSQTRAVLPAGVVAVDIWQPLQVLHRRAPHLARLPHVCYLPPGPNFIAASRLHQRASGMFRSIVTPFPHQARLYREAGGHVVMAAHAGLLALRSELSPAPPTAREPILALLPGSRILEVRHSLPRQYQAAREVQERHGDLRPVVCCATPEVEKTVQRLLPGVETAGNAREVMARARFGIICSGTAALEAAVLGCPGVVTYHGSALQRWEWRTFHVPKLADMRARGIASPYVSLPNILAEAELYLELIDASSSEIAAAALRQLARDPLEVRAGLDSVPACMSWADPREVVAEELAVLLNE